MEHSKNLSSSLHHGLLQCQIHPVFHGPMTVNLNSDVGGFQLVTSHITGHGQFEKVIEPHLSNIVYHDVEEEYFPLIILQVSL